MTKIAITGSNGRMGRALIRAVKFNPNVSQGTILSRGDDIKGVLKDCDVLIDFTRPEATLDALSICRNAGKAMVIGTTGFSDDALKAIDQASSDIPIVFAPNMSIGVNLTLKLLETLQR